MVSISPTTQIDVILYGPGDQFVTHMITKKPMDELPAFVVNNNNIYTQRNKNSFYYDFQGHWKREFL